MSKFENRQVLKKVIRGPPGTDCELSVRLIHYLKLDAYSIEIENTQREIHRQLNVRAKESPQFCELLVNVNEPVKKPIVRGDYVDREFTRLKFNEDGEVFYIVGIMKTESTAQYIYIPDCLRIKLARIINAMSNVMECRKSPPPVVLEDFKIFLARNYGKKRGVSQTVQEFEEIVAPIANKIKYIFKIGGQIDFAKIQSIPEGEFSKKLIFDDDAMAALLEDYETTLS